MRERDLYPEVEHTVDAYGGYWKKTTDMHFMNPVGQVTAKTDISTPVKPKKGDADFVWVFKSGKGAIVEVKYAATNFNFNEIKPEQRDLLAQFEGMSWLWLFMGTRLGSGELPRCAWLVPWADWIEIEDKFYQAGLAGMAHSQPHSLAHREDRLSAVQQLVGYELAWCRVEKKVIWRIGSSHPMYRVVHSISQPPWHKEPV